MLKTHYALYQFLTRQVEELEAEIARRMQPYAGQVNALATIPGVEKVAAWHLIAELGAHISVFPDADHCASWARVSPGSCESAGKQLSSRTKKGNKYLRRILTHRRGLLPAASMDICAHSSTALRQGAAGGGQ
jgi:transposase